MSLSKRWEAQKKDYEAATGEKKPGGPLEIIFGTGVAPALEKLEGSTGNNAVQNGSAAAKAIMPYIKDLTAVIAKTSDSKKKKATTVLRDGLQKIGEDILGFTQNMDKIQNIKLEYIIKEKKLFKEFASFSEKERSSENTDFIQYLIDGKIIGKPEYFFQEVLFFYQK